MTKRAVILVRTVPTYRQEAFTEAVKKLGYTPVYGVIQNPRSTDLLIIWNRGGTGDRQAKEFEKNNAPVIVVENSYLDMKGTKKSFAMALNHHNGAGTWPSDNVSRFEMLNINLLPWKPGGRFVTLLPQRGIGEPGIAMPRTWQARMLKQLTPAAVKHHVYTRRHPGTMKEKDVVPLEQDMSNTWAAVTWASGSGIKALVLGVPVFYTFDRWIGGSAAHYGVEPLRTDIDPISLMGNRIEMLENLAYAQWTVEEVITGDPIKRLVELHERKSKA